MAAENIWYQIVQGMSKMNSYLRGQLFSYYRRSDTMVERNGDRCMDAVMRQLENSLTILIMGRVS